ncbi:MAG: hypothetical protein R3C54_16670 [Parvularculaceae bacterium]
MPPTKSSTTPSGCVHHPVVEEAGLGFGIADRRAGIIGDLLAAARIIEDAHFRDFTFKGLRRIETAAFKILFLTEGDSAAGFQIANVDIGFKGRLAIP